MLNFEDLRFITTADGSHTLYVPELDEPYHSIHGAIQESKYIFIEQGLKMCRKNFIQALEIGFGTGLNALLTALEADRNKKRIHYTTLERYPISLQNARLLNYQALLENSGNVFERIHEAAWETDVEINPFFVLYKTKTDFVTCTLTGMYDVIYFDAFSPNTQPEMWTESCFAKIAAHCYPDAVLTTYCVKGTVRRALQKTGFKVVRLPGPKGKREILRGERI